MREDSPSRTALAVAIQRAAHQMLDHPPLFADPYAARILGARIRSELDEKRERLARSRFSPVLRAALASRARVAEDALADAVARGVRQYVILGAGLDTFALRNPHPSLRVFEVDHPRTQEWKRRLLTEEELAPANVTFVPVNFEKQDLLSELRSAGLNPQEPTFFSWLGVVMYLEMAAIEATLRDVATLAGREGGVVFDFFRRPERSQVILRFVFWLRGHHVARLGEPFRTLLEPDDTRALLGKVGFAHVDILTPQQINARYFMNRGDGLRVSPLNYIATATVALNAGANVSS